MKATETNAPASDGREEDGSMNPAESELLKDLIILSPRQKTKADGQSAKKDFFLRLPPIRAEEPVQSLRAALAEVAGFAHLTNFRFELENDYDTTNSDNSNSKISPSIISPFTGKDAVVSVPSQVKSLEQEPQNEQERQSFAAATSVVLDEYGDLTSLLEVGLRDGSGFRIVLETYDSASIKDHILRLRNLMESNAPAIASLVDENIAENDTIRRTGKEEFTNGNRDTEEGKNVTKNGTAAAASEEAQQKNRGDVKDKENNSKSPLPKLRLLGADSAKVDGRNLQDFFYLTCGEDPILYRGEGGGINQTTSKNSKGKHTSKKKKGKGNGNIYSKPRDDACPELQEPEEELPPEEFMRQQLPRLNELEEMVRVPCQIRYSGFHPPPPTRRWMGDLAYLEVDVNSNVPSSASETLFITATSTGFYVNNSSCDSAGNFRFNPAPAPDPCFSHALLDCLLQASNSFQVAWKTALDASKERTALIDALNKGPFISLFRVAIRGDFAGFNSASAAAERQSLESIYNIPSWLLPIPRKFENAADDAWNLNQNHSYSRSRADEELSDSFGVDIRTGAVRDWNEELQLAREMPTSNLIERVERARLIHKVLTEFGEASLLGVQAIADGQIAPMNPNEATRSQVYLHNNIFFSRAVDAGPETFKIAKGDKAARKSANRDVQCISTFHRLEKSGLFTLATVLIDYLGTRFVCQSILPGILIGEKSHTLLYGSVEAGVPLKWDKDFHNLLDEKLGESMMVASRPVLRSPLTEERMDEIKRLKNASTLVAKIENIVTEEPKKVGPADKNDVLSTCIPLEAKGILGSDRRKYVLDFGRLTPRDANWVPESKGGTGKWEECMNKNGAKSRGLIPTTLEDDEWTMNVLRPELVTTFTQVTMANYLKNKKEEMVKAKEKEDGEEKNKDSALVTADSNNSSDESKETADSNNNSYESKEKSEDAMSTPPEEDIEYLKTLRLNVNVFLPDMRSFEGIDEVAAEQIKMDEKMARDIAIFLWDDVLPKITKAIREGAVHQIPVDGKTLTEFLHRNGVNCRYLGRLADLAKEQEGLDRKLDGDLKQDRLTLVDRRTMPRCWLELIECEMVARAAKHVLDSYLTENGGVVALQPAQTVASFLSALVSESEETAAQTETRMEKRPISQPDEDDFSALTICDTGGEGDSLPPAIRNRSQVWGDINKEIGRRFRYSLTIFNSGNKLKRALYIPLLRRFCQRTGVRLIAKNYDVGGKCLCSGGNTYGGRLTSSYPISPLDIADIVPLMKHAAAYSEGFAPCSVSPSLILPPLQVSLTDARVALERAHIQTSSRALGKGLELAQEAGSLYQRVTENAVHPGVVESIDLMASIFLEAGDPVLAAANGMKALACAIQTGGFDSPHVLNAHLSLFQMFFAARQLDRSVKHLRAAIYILEISAGPRHVEHFSAYHKLGSVYSHADYNNNYLSSALHFFKEAAGRDSCDRLMEAITAKNWAKVLAGLGEYKDALKAEMRAYRTLSLFLGKEHQLTKESDQELKNYAKLAVEKGSRFMESEKVREEAAKAEAIAADLTAEEDKRKKKNNKKKKNRM